RSAAVPRRPTMGARAMPRVTCPDCDEVMKVPDGARASIRCPSCGSRILLNSQDDAYEVSEEREERVPRSRKSGRKSTADSGPIRGLIALIVLGPVGVVLAIASIFNVKAALAAAIVGFIGTCTASLCLFSLYNREGKRSHTEGDGSWGAYFARIGLGFK